MGHPKVFLDSNIIFSVYWTGLERSRPGLVFALREAKKVDLFASALVVQEVGENLVRKKPAAVDLLSLLLRGVTVLEDVEGVLFDERLLILPENDRLILATAVTNRMDVFLTGNISHFGPLVGRTVGSTLVLTAAQFLQRHR